MCIRDRNRVLRSNFCQNQLVFCSSIYIEVACSLFDWDPGFSVFSFPFWIEFQAVVDQGVGLYSQNFYQNQSVLPRSIYIEPVLTSREECNVFADLFFRIYLCLSRDLVNRHVFFAARFTLRQPKTPVGNATNLWTFCFEDYHYAFQETPEPHRLSNQKNFVYLAEKVPYLSWILRNL